MKDETINEGLPMTILGREPALLLDALKVALVMGATFGLDVTTDQQTWIVAALAAGFGLAKAFTTRPFAVTAVTDFVTAAGILAIGFGANISQAQLASLVAFASVVTVLVQRAQITPAATTGA